jgi:hypothetical protein
MDVSPLFDLMAGSLSQDDVKDMLHGAAKADFTAWSIKIAIVWYLMSGKVKKELESAKTAFNSTIDAAKKSFSDDLSKITSAFMEMTKEMKNVSATLAQQAESITGLKSDLSTTTTRVEKLEKQKES